MLETGFRKRIVVVGGGYAGVSCIVTLARSLRKELLAGDAEIILVEPNEYQQTLSEFDLVAASVGDHISDFCKLSYSELFAGLPWNSFKQVRGRLASLDTVDRAAVLEDGTRIGYWRLVLALGAEASLPPIPGLAEHAIPMWSLKDVSHLHDAAFAAFETAAHTEDEGERRRLLSFTVVGGGDTGVEVVGVMGYRYRRIARRLGLDPAELTVRLVEASDRILRSMPEKQADRARRHLGSLGVTVLEGTPLEAVGDGTVRLAGQDVPSSATVWAGGVKASSTTAGLGLPLGSQGRVKADGTLRVPSQPDIYAIGDAAEVHWEEKGCPLWMVAQFAIPEGETAARSIAAEYRGGEPEAFRPNHRGEMVSVGDYCVGVAFGVPVRGLLATVIKRLTYAEYWLVARGPAFTLGRLARMIRLFYLR